MASSDDDGHGRGPLEEMGESTTDEDVLGDELLLDDEVCAPRPFGEVSDITTDPLFDDATGSEVDLAGNVADVWQDDTGAALEQDEDETTIIDGNIGERMQPSDEEQGIDGLGPAFPDGDETIAPPGTVKNAATNEMPTSATPGPAFVTADVPNVCPPDPDEWDGVEDSIGGWNRTDSQVAVEPQHQDNEYSRRNTGVYDVGELRKDELARLVCIAGADAGREFPVGEREIGIGRIETNDVALNDHSVSREHARLIHSGDDFALIDLRSANGSFVNGVRIDRAKVKSGDEIGIGNVRMRFIEIGDVFKPVDAGGAPVLPGARVGPWQRLLRSPQFGSIAISAGMLLVTLIVTAAVLSARGGDGIARPQSDTIFQYYLQGVEAFKKHQWVEAEGLFAILLGLDPENNRAQQYLSEIDRERRLEGQLAAVQAARESGDLATAYAQASSIVDSVFTSDARGMMRDIDAELDARVTRARMTLDAGKAQEALELLQSVDTVRPGRPDVLGLRDRSTRALGGALPEVGQSPAPDPSRSTGSEPRVRTNAIRPSGAGPVGEAASLFGDTKVKEALALLTGDDRDEQNLRAKIEKFQQIYGDALQQHRAKQTQPAIKALKQAKAFEAKITGGRSKMAGEINRKLADMYYLMGVTPLSMGQYAEAYKHFRAADAVDPEHKLTRRGLEELAGKAEEIYKDGYRYKDLDPKKARDLWNVVLKIVPPSNEYHRKAKEWLDSM